MQSKVSFEQGYGYTTTTSNEIETKHPHCDIWFTSIKTDEDFKNAKEQLEKARLLFNSLINVNV